MEGVNIKMKLTKDQVKKVAKLAALSLNKEEIERFGKQLSETLEFVKKLDETDTKNTEATYSVTGLENITREDEVEPSLSADEALQNAKEKEGNFFKVKAIFNES